MPPMWQKLYKMIEFLKYAYDIPHGKKFENEQFTKSMAWKHEKNDLARDIGIILLKRKKVCCKTSGIEGICSLTTVVNAKKRGTKRYKW